MLEFRENLGIAPLDPERTLGVCLYGGIEEIVRVFDDQKELFTDEIQEKKIILFSEEQQKAVTVVLSPEFDQDKFKEDDKVRLIDPEFKIWAMDRNNDIKIEAMGLELVDKKNQGGRTDSVSQEQVDKKLSEQTKENEKKEKK